MTDPDLKALAGEPALTGLEGELLHALEVTNAILEMIQKDMRSKTSMSAIRSSLECSTRRFR